MEIGRKIVEALAQSCTKTALLYEQLASERGYDDPDVGRWSEFLQGQEAALFEAALQADLDVKVVYRHCIENRLVREYEVD